MEIPMKRWYSAINKRHSRRQFNGNDLATDIYSSLLDFSKELSGFVQGARVVVVNEQPEAVFKGAVGSYGKIKGAPAYAAFIGNMENRYVQQQVGYLGQCFILEATALELATCWVGGFFRPDTVEKQVDMKSDEQVLAVTPIGYADKNYTLEEKFMSGFSTTYKRKDLQQLCLQDPQQLPEWAIPMLNAARLAPSAVNRQPWRFSVQENTIKISVDNTKDTHNISKRLDCGIAMLHVEVGAGYNGIRGQWHNLDEKTDVALFELID